MDPLMHILLPTLFLLAIRLDPKMVILFSPLTILPDFDAAFGLHRAVFHSFVPVVVIPVALIVYSRLRKPEWLVGALLVQFFLASHVVLDLGGVAFLWPFVEDQLYFDPVITFGLQGGIDFDFQLEYGWKPYEPMETTQFVSESGFAILFLAALMTVVFRKEAVAAFRGGWKIVVDLVSRLRR